MNQNLEIEYKTLLTQTQAANLLSLSLFSFSGKQSNTYYDTSDNYFQLRNIVIRIRKKNDTYLFTAKEKTDKGLQETEFTLENHSVSNSKISTYMNQFKNDIKLQPIGSSITYRYTYDDEFGQWCLDFNVFQYTSDVELEYELHQGVEDKKDYFLKKLDYWNIRYNPCPSKFVRMLQQNKNQP